MLTHLLSYIELKKFILLKFYFIFSFLSIIVIGLKDFNILKILKILNKSRYNKFLAIY